MPKDYLGKSQRLVIYRPVMESNVRVPFISGSVPAGFPSPAADYLQNKIDLNEKLIENPPATIVVQVKGLSMIGKEIYDGDWLIVDKSKTPVHGSVILARLDGEDICKTLYKRNGIVRLDPENEAFKPIVITVEHDLEIQGVVTYSIHDHRVCSR
jgi:DNA polymerase V